MFVWLDNPWDGQCKNIGCNRLAGSWTLVQFICFLSVKWEKQEKLWTPIPLFSRNWMCSECSVYLHADFKTDGNIDWCQLWSVFVTAIMVVVTECSRFFDLVQHVLISASILKLREHSMTSFPLVQNIRMLHCVILKSNAACITKFFVADW